MTWLAATVAFVYDFLADDGWELLAGLAILLPLTYAVSHLTELGGGLVMIAGVLVTMTISLGRKAPRRR